MSINFDKALGIHQQAVTFRAKRAELLANNIANADTPGYKAKDVEFKDVMSTTIAGRASQLKTSHAHHISTNKGFVDADMQYRIPSQPSLDGNTVDSQQEIAAYSENAIRYMASLQFLNSRFKGLMTALRGE